jgi:hypothetical protein
MYADDTHHHHVLVQPTIQQLNTPITNRRNTLELELEFEFAVALFECFDLF